MRLLERGDTGEFRLMKQLPNDAIPEIPPYAILSHTWGDEEVLFKDLEDGTAKKKAGYAKIQFCGDQAWRDGLKYFWADTCCIDKSDIAELQHALNSMFQWYRNAAKCYVYLTDVSTRKRDADGNSNWELAFLHCRWFTRGWTLQELIAPTIVEFFSAEGVRLGDKQSLGHQIHNATGIPLGALQSNALSDFSIEERISWVKNRTTTRKEDKAYSLFGIFGVQMPLLYGEGEDGAFGRLREEISKHDRCLANLHSTDPRLDKMRIEESKGGLLADAYRWVLATPEFRQWHDQSESRLLWVKGDPGKGKTMLLCGIINELEQAIVADGHCRNVAYFFCQATDSRINNAIDVLRGLIYLLARQQPRLIAHVRKYTDAGKSLSDANAWVALSDVLGRMLGDPNLRPTCLVIDALDECIIDLPKLLNFIIRVSPAKACIKWLLSSRNEHLVEREMMSIDEKARLSLELKGNAEQVSHAINLYIDYKLSTLRSLHGRTVLRAQIQDSLYQKADGTFLWVALVVQELEGIEHWDLLQVAEELPTGLYPLYDRMVRQIQQLARRTLQFCQAILSTAVVTYRPLYLAEIGGLSGFPEEISGSMDDIRKIITMCGSFLTVRDNQIYLVHQSVKDYLCEQASVLLFPYGAATAHYHILNRSLRILSDRLQRDIYGLRAPGFPIDQVRVPDPDPLATIRYPCVSWVDHLYDSQSSNNIKHTEVFQDGGVIDNFLRKHYLHWLEALSLCESMSQGIFSMAKLESILQQPIITSQLSSLVYDMRRFALYCRQIVENYPLQVYASALVFSPARSITRSLFKQEERRCITTRPIVEEDWNACTQTLEGHGDEVYSVAFSPDSKLVASGSHDKTIKIWDTTAGACRQTLEGHSDNINSVAFSPDLKLVASASYDKSIRIWDTVTWACTQALKGHSSGVNSAAFSPNSKLVVSGSMDQTVKIWDVVTGACTQTLEGHSDDINSVSFSPDSKLVASGSGDKTIKIWDTVAGVCTQTLEGHSDWVESVTFSPDSKLIASGSRDRAVKIWDTVTMACTQTLEGHSDWVESVAFSHDSKLVASGSYDKTIKIWDAAAGVCTQTLEGQSGCIESVAFSPDSKLVASGSSDWIVNIWDAVPRVYMQTPERHRHDVNSVIFSADLKLVVSSSMDDTVKIWDVATGECTQTLEGHSDWVEAVTFSPDSKLVASGATDKTIKIWDAVTGVCTQTLEGHGDWVRSVAFSPDSKLVASGSKDQTVKIWDTVAGVCTQTLEGHSGCIESVAFSHDSKLVASGSYDKTIKIWNVVTGACTQTLEGYSDWRDVTSLKSFSDTKLRCHVDYDISSNRWITKDSEKWLWLPPECMAACWAVMGSTITVGCSSGRVLVITFPTDNQEASGRLL